MTSVDCKLCRENIHSYVHECLSPEDKKQFEAHLGICLECRREVEQEMKLSEIMQNWEVVKTTKAFDIHLTHRLTEVRNRPKKSWLQRLFNQN